MHESSESFFEVIANIGLKGVTGEPARLRAQANAIETKITKSALDNYTVYLKHSDALSEMSQTTTALSKTIGSMSDSMPATIAQLNSFGPKFGKQCITSLHLNRSTIKSHSTLMELLEVPQLMDTCVRNVLYDEALSLVSFANTLERRHNRMLGAGAAADYNVISSIVTEIRSHCITMKEQLLSALKTDISTINCMQAIQHLRRLDSQLRASLKLKSAGQAGVQRKASKDKLLAGLAGAEDNRDGVIREQFLACRDVWLRKSIDDIGTVDAYHFLDRMIEKARLGWSEIVSLYKTVFKDETVSNTSADLLLHNWLLAKVDEFSVTLTTHLALVTDGGNVAKLLERCMAFGSKLSAVGADVRLLVLPIFELHIIGMTKKRWQAACNTAHEQMLGSTFSWQDLFGPYSTSERDGLTDAADLSCIPPRVLAEVPLLAHFCNSYLASLNELRLCPLLSVAAPLSLALNSSMHSLVDSLATYKSVNEDGSLTSDRSKRFAFICEAVGLVLFPYMTHCLRCVFELAGTGPAGPSSFKVNVPGVLHKMRDCGILSVDALVKYDSLPL